MSCPDFLDQKRERDFLAALSSHCTEDHQSPRWRLKLTQFLNHALSLMLFLLALQASVPADAGVMTRESMQEVFPPPYSVGEKDKELPIWPIFQQVGKTGDGTSKQHIGYAFESIDLAPIPGFAGGPFNLLILLGTKGEFVDVRVLSQHEPVFVGGLGEAPLIRFVDQYKGLSLMHNIKITNTNNASKAGSTNVYIEGVTKATASLKILNQTILSSSLKVARAKLGYAHGRDPDRVAHIKPDVFTPMDWDALVKAGLITKKTFLNREVEQAFAGTVGQGLDEEAKRAPEDSFVDLYFAHINVPTAGRNLLTPQGWQYLQNLLDPGDHALLLMGVGRYSIVGEDFVRGSIPDRLTLSQEKLPIEIRDLDANVELNLPPKLKSKSPEWRIFRVVAPAGLDPSQPLEFKLRVSRAAGTSMFAERVSKDFGLSAQMPEKYFEAASSDDKTWYSIWQARSDELAVLILGLVVLFWALRKQNWLSDNHRRLAYFRNGYLLFTLGFIGWYAQGQLSIVNLTAVVQGLVAGRNLGFLLYDPMTVSLWGFILLTIFLWGRGTFCGWLCPFGALQEFVSKLASPLRLKKIRISDGTDGRLKKIKYAVLAAILVTACVSTPWTDRLVEVEPFKTSITLLFNRSWPFVLWAGFLIFLSVFVYKGFCRYLCPLGAGLALLGHFRSFKWIARRTECGKPCQRCRNECPYQAIHKSGEIDYDECFQCLICVEVYESDKLCVPLIQKNRKARRAIPVHAVAATQDAKPNQGEAS